MKHEIMVTPLNCGFGGTINTFITFDENNFNNDNGRRLLVKDPYTSWFKFKDAAGSPFIEPAIYGLKAGDIITIDFDILKCKGNALGIGVGFFAIKNGKTTTDSPIETHKISSERLTSSYTHFSIPYVIMPSVGSEDGILLNIRNFYDDGSGSIYIIKNIKITVETDNPNFKLSNNVIDYKDKKDFVKMINIVSGTVLCGSTFVNNQTFYDNGNITYSNGALNINVTANGKWAGIVGVISQSSYGNPIAVYLEYKMDSGGTNAIYSQGWSADDVRQHTESRLHYPLTNGSYSKFIGYIQGTAGNIDYNIVNTGSASFNQNWSLKRMIISIPRFDDKEVREPNNLIDLYPNKRFNSL